MRRKLAGLSARELEVFKRIGRGETLSAIARDFGVSQSTVSTYRSRVLAKCGLENNAQIAIAALNAGFVRCPRMRRPNP